MSQRDEFLKTVLPALTEVDTAFHNGDPSPRFAIWSHDDPVTLFGAALSGNGWAEIGPVFEQVARGFADCESFEYEVIAADAAGDLAYIAGIEHTTASIRGASPKAYSLRVTTIFRREGGEWKVVHRHADAVPDDPASEQQVRRLAAEPG